MDAALQSLLDKQAITELVYTCARAADRHDNELMRSCYHEDAVDDHGAFFKGLAMEFIEHLPEIQATMLILHHNITTINIALDGDYAEGEIYVLAYHQVKSKESDPMKSKGSDSLTSASEPMDLLIGGRYFDKYEKRDGHWKFTYRGVVADWATTHSPSVCQLDHPMLEGSYFGTPGEGDPSYKVFRLLKRGP